MAIDNFPTTPYDGAGRRLVAITPSDSVPFTEIPRAIYVGVTGDISVQCVDDIAPTVLKAVPVGLQLVLRPLYVKATGTTATSLVAVY